MAFEILARLGLNATGFHSGMKRAESAGVAFSRSLRNNLAGAFSTAAALQFVRSVGLAADAVGDLGDQANLSNRDIQEFTAIASKAGIDVLPLLQFIERLKEARREAQSGKAEFRHLFNEMGIDPTRLDALAEPGDLFRSFAAEFAKLDKETQSAVSTAIGGTRAGGRLSSTISAIGRGEKSGELQFSDKEVRAASQVDDMFSSMGRQLKVAYAKYLGSDAGGILGLFFRSAQKKADEEFKAEALRAKSEPGRKITLLPPTIEKEKEPEPDIVAAVEAAQPRQFQQDLSALQRIGEQIIGGGGNNIQRDQLMELREIKRGVKELNSGTTVFP